MNTRVEEAVDLSQFLPLKTFLEKNEHLFETESSLRYLLRTRHDNGLTEAGAVLKMGTAPNSPIILHQGKFAKWLSEQRV